MNQAQEILQSMAERVATSASVRQVFGEPIERGGRTIIPVARVQYGLAEATEAANKRALRLADRWPAVEVAGAAA
jgi:uncharacterized spore protein YtfJ